MSALCAKKAVLQLNQEAEETKYSMSRWRTTKQKVNRPSVSQKISIPPTPLKLRFKSAMVDLFMITMPICYGVIYGVMGGGSGFETNKIEGWGYIFVAHAVVILLFWRIKGQTPGMKAYEITLCDKTGVPPSVQKLIIRFILTFISFFCFIIFLLPFFRKDRKFFHDLISGTHPRYFAENS